MKRILVYIAVLIAALLLLAAAAWWWLTDTRGGAAWLLGQVETRVERFGYERLDGDLSDGLVLESVEFSQAGLSAAVDRLELAVQLRLLPLRVTIDRLDLDGVDLTLPPPGPEDPEAGPFEPGDYSAPVEVLVRQLEITGLDIRSNAGEELVQVRQFDLSARYAESLTIESLVLDMEPWQLTADGELGLSAPWQSGLDLALGWAVDTDTTQRLNARLSGPLDDLDVALDAQGPLTASGQVDVRGLPAIESLTADVALQGELDGWPGLEGRIDEIELSAGGGLDDWQAELAGRVAWPGQPTARLDLGARGDRSNVRIERGDIDLLDGRVGVTGALSLDPALAADADIVLEGLDFTGLYPEWPDQARLSGSMDAAWDGNELVVDKLDLRAPPAPMELTGRASLDVDTQALELVLEWQSLVWPPVLDQSEPLFSSESGRLEADGTLDEWRAEVEAWLALPEQPRAKLELNADGNAEMAHIRAGSLRVDQAGQLRISGTAGFGAEPSADLALSLVDFDPGFAVPELQGSINGELAVQLEQLDPLITRLAIDRLAGQLRDLPLQGSGALSVRGNHVEQADLGVSLGDNRLDLTSDSGSQWQVVVDVVRLEQLWPGLDGSVGLEASIDPAAHSATWTLQSPGASWLDYRTAQVESSGSIAWGERPNIEAVFEAVDIDLNPWERLDQFEIRLSGDCSGHRLTSYFSGTRATLDLAVAGRLPDCLETPLHWDGQIQTLALSDTPVGAWQLAEPLPVAIDEARITAGPGCLWTVASDGRLCLNRLVAGDTGHAIVAFNSVPIDLLLLPADPVFTLGSALKGIAEARWDAGGVREIDAELLLGPGAARMLEAEEDLLRIGGARLSLASPTSGALLANLELRLEGQSQLDARASIPDLNVPGDMELDARANLDLPNLAAFNRLAPELDQLGGRLEAEFVVTGPLAGPDFDGRIAIRDGEFAHAPLGSRVEQLDLTLEADESSGRLTGQFVAGDGRGRISGGLSASESVGWRGDLEVSGSKLQLTDVDWLSLTVSPDLSLSFTPEQLDLNGDLVIDRARLGLPPGSEQRVATTDDVVIVNGQPEDEEEPNPLPTRRIDGTVKLQLGDDVKLEAAGLETRLAGGMDITWTPEEALPRGQGRIRLVEGSYRAYGQNLEVTEGDVLFTGYPIDNPVLEIEAVREIFGDPQVERAGVRIRGPARDPEILLFTAPPTSREKALAYILTGADFDHASGQGAFSVGFWVLPNVFVSYGLGLFDTGNVLAARWELSRRWGLRATSGERDTGADLSFIIDR